MFSKKISRKRRFAALLSVFLIATLAASFFFSSQTSAVKPAAPVTLDPKTIPKFVNQLIVPPVFTPDSQTASEAAYTISMVTGTQQILPLGTVLPGINNGQTPIMTNVWGYQGNAVAKGRTLEQLGISDGTTLPDFFFSPSGTFETTRDQKVRVTWINGITTPMMFAVDPTLNWANPTNAFPPGDIFSTSTGGVFPLYPPGFDGTVSTTNPQGLNAQTPVALVPHLHGAEDQSGSDGGPDSWWTSAETNLKGPNYSTVDPDTEHGQAVYLYDNSQEPNTLFYHDHALGITRLNVMSGLAGFYLIREPTTGTVSNTFDQYLSNTFTYGVNEIPIAIQDRTFTTDGQLWFPTAGINPTIHPYWLPEFFGDTIMVNGMVWPNLDVTPGWYRLRIVDGSNARFYTMSFSNKMPFTVIGADGGYLQSPVTLKSLTIAPGERADILVQFTPAMVGSKIVLENKANTPFPKGTPVDPKTTGQIMQFTVKATGDATAETQGVTTLNPLPASLNPTLPLGQFPTLPATTNQRIITLNEVMGAGGPVAVLINGQPYRATATETPTEGSTEEWVIINLTADTHPIHLHLVTFQLVSRQPFQATKYTTDWLKLNAPYAPPFPEAVTPKTLDPTPYYQGKAILPTLTESTWKDTIQMNPGEVTTIRVRFTAQDGSAFPFDPTSGPGYVWHCHIIDHEDNEMMRPLIIK